MTVALPILSACGQETCILPSAVLSSHTGGFQNPTFRDLTEDMPAVMSHWMREGISFDTIYTGYLGSAKQIAYVQDIFKNLLAPGGITVVDPAMADHGKLYKGFDEAYVAQMRSLCTDADIILPNVTEAAMLTGTPYRENPDWEHVEHLLEKLADMDCKTVVLTGVGDKPDNTGVVVYADGQIWHYVHPKSGKSYHGTGDIFASAFVGSMAAGKDLEQAVKIAADYTALCIEKTNSDPAHWYGVKFEAALPQLIQMLE